ncbi:MAG: hypothetical protein AAFO94_04495 [Bacteroidota bacterium]
MSLEGNKNKTKTKNIIAFAGLTMMLVVFPAVSWYYLQQGLNYQKEARAELKDYGKVKAFSFDSNLNKPITEAAFDGNFSVATFINADDETITTNYMQLLSRLHEQFDLRPDVKFMTHVSSKFKSGDNLISELNTEATVQDKEQLYFLTGETAALEQQAIKGYRLPLENQAFAKNTYVALVDTVGTVIQYYDFQNEAQVRRLVEHIAMLIPKDIPEKPVKEVEAEK